MCIIAFKPEDITISNKTLENCWESNDDGAGFMYVKKNELVVVKGLMTFDDFMKEYEPHRKKRATLHFRIRSAGLASPENTHPFEIVPSKLAFVHNGHISTVTPTHPRSDTAEFNESILKPLADRNPDFLEYEGVRELIMGFGGWSKFVFMDNTGRTWILNASSGTVEGGVWYSNTAFRNTYRPYKKTYGFLPSTTVVNSNNNKALAQARKEAEEAIEKNDSGTKDALDIYIEATVESTSTDFLDCLNCPSPLLTDSEYSIGVCEECQKDLVCQECNLPFTQGDWADGVCSNCNSPLNPLEILDNGQAPFDH